jgi:hypothetical protein
MSWTGNRPDAALLAGLSPASIVTYLSVICGSSPPARRTSPLCHHHGSLRLHNKVRRHDLHAKFIKDILNVAVRGTPVGQRGFRQ